VTDRESVREGCYAVGACRRLYLLATLPKAREDGNGAAEDVDRVDLRAGVALIADDDRGAADIFKARVLLDPPD